MPKIRLAACAASIVAAVAYSAAAQPAPVATVPTPPAAAPSVSPPASPAVGGREASQGGFGGPLIPGVCLLSREAVLSQSLAGQAATARLRQLGQKAQANFDGERRRLEGEAKALQGQQASLPPQQIQHRQQQLQARAQAAQTEAAQVSRELEATRAKAMGVIEQAIQPVVLAAYQAKGCGLLLQREAVLGGNLANDLTPAVVQGLDAKMTTITFEREHLPPAPTSGSR